MSSRRGLLAAFLLSFSPVTADAKKRHHKRNRKKHHKDIQVDNPSYISTINDYTTCLTESVAKVTESYREALAPYGIDVTYIRKDPDVCVADVSVCEPGYGLNGIVGTGWGRWEKASPGVWSLTGGVNFYGTEHDPRFWDPCTHKDAGDFIACHEIGHTFGLYHVPEGTNSCMQTPASGSIGPHVNVKGPTDYDIANIVALLPKG